MPLILMIALKEGREGYRLRLDDLPVSIPGKTLRGYQTKWKRIGLLFTSRVYYTREEMRRHFGADLPRTPRLKHVIYDLSNLMHNVALVAQEWTQRNAEHQTQQEARAISNPAPYAFPDDYAHDVELSPDVAFRIVTGAYDRGKAGEDFSQAGLKRWYIPPRWWHRAHEMAGLSPDLKKRGEDARFDLDALRDTLQQYAVSPVLPQNEAPRRDQTADRGHIVPGNEAVRGGQTPEQAHVPPGKKAVHSTYYPKSGQSPIEEDKEEEEDRVSLVLSRFAERKGAPEYRATDRERDQARQLLRRRYSEQQISAAIDSAFDTRPPGARPIRGFGFVYHYIHHRSQPTEVAGHTDGQPTGVQTGLNADDPLVRTCALLRQAEHSGAVYDTPIIRLALRRFTEGDDPHSPGEVHEAVMATVVRGIAPERLVGYVSAILEDRRSQERERQPSPRARDQAPLDEDNDKHVPSLLTPAERTWQVALSELEPQMTKATYSTWIRPLTAPSLQDGVLTLEAPNRYVKDWVETRLRTPVERTVSAIMGCKTGIEIRIGEDASCAAIGQELSDTPTHPDGLDVASLEGDRSVRTEGQEEIPLSATQGVCPRAESCSPRVHQSVCHAGNVGSHLYTPGSAVPAGLTSAHRSARAAGQVETARC
jgi:hypothetical protein